MVHCGHGEAPTHRSFLLAAGLLATTSAYAAPYAYRVTSSVTYLDDFVGALGGTVAVGDALYLDYVYDPSTPDSNPMAEVGDYFHTTAPYGVTLTVGPWAMRTDPANVNFLVEYVNDYYNQDNFVFHSYNNEVAAGPAPLDVQIISWQLDDTTMTALSSTAPLPIDLSAWQSVFGIDVMGSTGGFFGDSWMLRAIPSAIRPMPFLTLAGGAGAPVTFTGTGFSAGDTVAVLSASRTGTFQVPSGPCVGGHTGLASPTLRRTFAADAGGGFNLTAALAPAMSGQLVVVFDMTTCTASPAVRIP